MVNIFQLAVERLVDLGFYNFLLPFILFSTVLYAVLRKTQILGESPLLQGTIAVVAGLFVFGMPVVVGIDIVQPLTAFLTQAAIVVLVFVIGFLIAGFFYPNITELVERVFKPPGPGGWLIWTVVGIAAAAGLFAFVGKPINAMMKAIKIPSELMIMSVVMIVIFIVFLIITLGRQVER